MSVDAVVFDKDGVLADSEKVKAEAWQRTLDLYGVREGFGWYLRNLGPTSLALAMLAKRTFGLDADADTLAGEWTAHYRAREQRAEAITRNVELLKSLSRRYRIAVASSMDKASIEAEMERFGCRQFIAACVSGEDVPNNKPAPDVYLAAAAALAIQPARCVAIEDSPPGIAAAKAAGMLCIAYRNPLYVLDLSRADGIMDALGVSRFERVLRRASAKWRQGEGTSMTPPP